MTIALPPDTDPSWAATFVLGLDGALTSDDYAAAVQRIQRALRPGDHVVPMDTRTIGVHCTSLVNERETDAVAGRLADAVRGPVTDDVRTYGVCVGSATLRDGEAMAGALHRAAEAMRQMRQARAGLLAPAAPDVPGQRSGGSALLRR
ncbi:MAG TPA: hypothetical protein VNA20_12550 [Frankiaceae bacterium]|nr:hypothetical protein [Frankiaceae bacterium]